jgi:hypothetical protein
LQPQGGIFPDQTAERPLKPGRKNQFTHGSLGAAQSSNYGFHGHGFEPAGTK